jgi:hypothetical protein
MITRSTWFSIWFGFYQKKITKLILKKTKTGSNRPVSVWFFRIKLVQTGLARFFPVFFVFVRFFRFQTYKTETELVGYFKILIGFFHGLIF